MYGIRHSVDASSGYYNLNLDKKSSYLTIFACQYGQYQHARLLFETAFAGDMFQMKIEEIFKELPNVCGIADDILIVGYVENRR